MLVRTSLRIYEIQLTRVEDVSGMKEDLNIKGNEYTYMLSRSITETPSNLRKLSNTSVLHNCICNHANPSKPDRAQGSATLLHYCLRVGVDCFHVSDISTLLLPR